MKLAVALCGVYGYPQRLLGRDLKTFFCSHLQRTWRSSPILVSWADSDRPGLSLRKRNVSANSTVPAVHGNSLFVLRASASARRGNISDTDRLTPARDQSPVSLCMLARWYVRRAAFSLIYTYPRVVSYPQHPPRAPSRRLPLSCPLRSLGSPSSSTRVVDTRYRPPASAE